MLRSTKLNLDVLWWKITSKRKGINSRGESTKNTAASEVSINKPNLNVNTLSSQDICDETKMESETSQPLAENYDGADEIDSASNLKVPCLKSINDLGKSKKSLNNYKCKKPQLNNNIQNSSRVDKPTASDIRQFFTKM